MLVAGFPAGSFAANCYLVAPAPGEECVIIDPGQDAEPGIEDLLAKYRLNPIAVLLTHGHIDHMWSVAPVCGAKDIPAYIHPDDRDLLTDPAKGIWVVFFESKYVHSNPTKFCFTKTAPTSALNPVVVDELTGLRTDASNCTD